VTLDKKSLLGPYTAELTWSADTASAPPTKIRFWGAPLKIILPILAVLIILFLLVWVPRKRIKRAVAAFKAAGEDPKKDEAAQGAHAATPGDEGHKAEHSEGPDQEQK